MFRSRLASVVAALAVSAVLIPVASAPAEAKATRIEKADRKGGKVLKYVEPFRIRKGEPTRLYVEFRDGSTWVFTPCRYEDSPNCFWWAEASGNGRGYSFIDLKRKTYYLH